MARLVRHGRERRIVAGGDDFEPRRHGDHVIAVTHPDVQHPPILGIAVVFQAIEQRESFVGLTRAAPNSRCDEPSNLASQLRRHGLHAVANSEHGYAQ